MSTVTPVKGDIRTMEYSPTRERRKALEKTHEDAKALAIRLTKIPTERTLPTHAKLIHEGVGNYPKATVQPLLEEAWLSLEAKRSILKGKLREIQTLEHLLTDLRTESVTLQHHVTELEIHFTKIKKIPEGASGRVKAASLKLVTKKAHAMSSEELDLWIEKLEAERANAQGGESDG